jgi:molybdopterin converting factor subunit 1
MRLTVLFFASTRDAAGRRSLVVDLPRDATVEALLQGLISDYPALARSAPNLMVAVNSEYADRGMRLHEGDEVALIPPVSGGCDVEL